MTGGRDRTTLALIWYASRGDACTAGGSRGAMVGVSATAAAAEASRR